MRWYFIFFLVSGFCSLVYEVVWLRLAMAEFGVITPLVSVVLSVFMAGLGLGSWAAGRLVVRLGERSRAVPREIPLEQLIAAAPRTPALQDDRPINEYYLLRRKLGLPTYKEE